MTLALALVLGVAVGILLGLLGGGGSILAVPVLVYALGMDLSEAIPTSLLVIGVASATGAIPKVRARLVEWRLAAIFAATGIVGTVVGSALGRHLPEAAVMIGFAIVMIIAGARMLRSADDVGTACKTGDSGIDWRRCAPRSIPTGFGVGVLTGLFGVGGGFLIIPALVLLLGIEMGVAVGTSLVVIVANSAAGLIAQADGLGGNWALTAAFAGATIAGSLVAGRLSTRIDTDKLRTWFAYLVFAVAGYVLVDTLVLS
ncbi:permease [Rhodococcoides fascians]|uniref:sulfite exporter TauE/SafE family protein n=1 Tax=Nocardiaceae TaxID=85025 RepID=UPI000B9B1603|nr:MULTISPECIES: sulfite exporter TauE/SafE family protein [Rhodococcus]OZE79957.1 permease [Rhodococcus fascians]OZF08910.1 permease [Rhodococcus fascians]OZF11774.1 permease [Rhodococcus fascians]OZF59230.1 permease [Rhodococcus fascians]OZF59770.1 permease [Rhodococcus fascians]